MNAITTFPPGTLGLPCKVAVSLCTGEHAVIGTAPTWSGARDIPVPPQYADWTIFETVEGLASELALDVYEMGYFEGPPLPQEDRL